MSSSDASKKLGLEKDKNYQELKVVWEQKHMKLLKTS